MPRINKTLICGPWIGEFGWELVEWYPRIVTLSKFFKNILVISYESSRELYSKYLFYPHNNELLNSSFGVGRNFHNDNDLIDEAAKHYNIKNYISFKSFSKQRFIRLLQKRLIEKTFEYPSFSTESKYYDLCFHFRNFNRKNDLEDKNYPLTFANILTNCLKKDYKICAIGHPSMSYCPPDVDDNRNINLSVAIDCINNSRLILGGSSAPMHLAQLYKKPTVTWFNGNKHKHLTNRYLKDWNPFNSPVKFASKISFQPNPDLILNCIREIEF